VARKVGKSFKGRKMNTSLISIANGFCFGIGIILAAALMRVVLHLSFC
jgi:hypothetical protein